MPTRPLSHAQRVGRTASDRSYDRTRRQADPRLAAAARIRSSARWQAVRRVYAVAHPLCADPWGRHAKEGRVEPMTQVDHVVALADGGEPFADENLQSLCFRCHAVKTATERKGTRHV